MHIPFFSPISTRRSWIGAGLVFAVIGVAVGWAVYHWRNHKPDETSAFREKNEGIACIERFNYPGAVQAFEETIKKAPDWPVAKINLGIALMWLAREGEAEQRKISTNRAIALFQDVLKDDADNPHANFCLGFIHFELLNNFQASESYLKAVTLK